MSQWGQQEAVSPRGTQPYAPNGTIMSYISSSWRNQTVDMTKYRHVSNHQYIFASAPESKDTSVALAPATTPPVPTAPTSPTTSAPSRPATSSNFLTFRNHAVPAIAATTISGFLLHPVVGVGLRMQFKSAVMKDTQTSGMITTTKELVKSGIKGAYRGFSLRLLQSGFAGIQWGSYGVVRKTTADHLWSQQFWESQALMLGTRMFITAAKSPLEVIKDRMQVDKSFSSTLQVCRQLLASQGIAGLWAGYTATVVRDVLVAYSMLYGSDVYGMLIQQGLSTSYSSYLRGTLSDESKGVAKPWWVNVTAGAMSGLTAAILTQPLDFAKTVLQTQTVSVGGTSQAVGKQYKSTADVLLSRVREGGILSLYKGGVPRAIHLVVGHAIHLPVFKFCMKGWVLLNKAYSENTKTPSSNDSSKG